MGQTPSYLTSLKKESVVQSVINRLTEGMRRGELKPGDKIPTEPELAESLGVARSSIREAIKILTYLGVLESKRHEGTFVCSGFEESMIDPMVYGIILNQDSFEDLMELREMTEAGLMRLAIKNHDEGEIEELEDRLKDMEAVIASNDEETVRALFEADDKFHDKIAEMGKNPMADKINRVVRTLTYAVRYETVSSMVEKGKGKEFIEAHKALLNTIKKGDVANITDKVRDSYFETELMERRC
ncbi:MAG: FadR family transcriptional regulator [Mogibacterium sp.]|nr:FadR family transcriptional regulator [Mogibacterium sp.]MBR2539907.1 FadR family transcriptional regulator [Mogibacterium sp.]